MITRISCSVGVQILDAPCWAGIERCDKLCSLQAAFISKHVKAGLDNYFFIFVLLKTAATAAVDLEM